MPVRPSDKEEEHFKKLEFERRMKHARENAERLAREERDRLQKLHFMKCPKCGMELQSIDFNGVTVDRCANCKGMWFDEGEVEKTQKKSGFFERIADAFKE